MEATPSLLETKSKVKIFNLDEASKAKVDMAAHGVIVSFAGGTLHGQLFDEDNVYVSISSIESGAEAVLLYEDNNNDDR